MYIPVWSKSKSALHDVCHSRGGKRARLNELEMDNQEIEARYQLIFYYVVSDSSTYVGENLRGAM